jgi:Ca2+/H+ antiporter
MLGSILTNLLFVFGMSCLIGGVRWQVQEIRHISGNVSVGMLMLATAGSALPAALFLSGQLPSKALNDEVPSHEELLFCRVNAAVMVVMYLCYLLFQLGTHKGEFDDNDQATARHSPPARRNLWCQHYFMGGLTTQSVPVEIPSTTTRSRRQRHLEKFHDSNNNLVGGMLMEERSGSSSQSSLSYDTDPEAENGDSGGLPAYPNLKQSPRKRRRRKQKHTSEHPDILEVSSQENSDIVSEANSSPGGPGHRGTICLYRQLFSAHLLYGAFATNI